MIDVDVDPEFAAKVSQIEMRTAKKIHECQERGKAINPGDKYEYTRCLWENGWDTLKTFETCCEIRGCFLCGFYYGGLWEEMHEYVRWESDDLGLCVLDKLSPKARAVMIEYLD